MVAATLESAVRDEPPSWLSVRTKTGAGRSLFCAAHVGVCLLWDAPSAELVAECMRPKATGEGLGTAESAECERRMARDDMPCEALPSVWMSVTSSDHRYLIEVQSCRHAPTKERPV
jgi:hypothetical protein